MVALLAGDAVTVFDSAPQGGGFIRSQIPKFRLPDSVIDEEVGYILNLGVEFRGGVKVESMKKILAEIQSGQFAEEWIAEYKGGLKNFNEIADRQAKHPIEVTGKKLRGMMDWIDTEF